MARKFLSRTPCSRNPPVRRVQATLCAFAAADASIIPRNPSTGTGDEQALALDHTTQGMGFRQLDLLAAPADRVVCFWHAWAAQGCP